MSEVAGTPRIVLTMIVRNEAAVIERCIAPLLAIVDAYCIVDTGSTDGTQDVARRALATLPGAVYDIPWRDFAYNRTRALELAAPFGEYAFTVDADNICHIEPGFDKRAFAASLVDDYYYVDIEQGNNRYGRVLLTSTRLPFRYRGVIHEFADGPPGARDGGTVRGFHMSEHHDGARSRDPSTYANDAAAIERALRNGEDSDLRPRYLFYLAQSHHDAGNHERAMEIYEARGRLDDGWIEERAVAWLRCGHLRRSFDRPLSEVLDAYSLAFDAAPFRAEPLCHAASVCRDGGRLAAAYPYASLASSIRRPESGLFLEHDVYDWRSLYEHSIAAYWVGRYAEGLRLSLLVLTNPRLPDAERQAVEQNVSLYRARV